VVDGFSSSSRDSSKALKPPVENDRLYILILQYAPEKSGLRTRFPHIFTIFMHFIDEFPILYDRLQKKQKLPLSIFGGKLITKKTIKFH
jgi:hypothetical protein